MDSKTKTFIIDCINQHRCDDLARAKAAFRGLSPEEMQQKYGQSDQTRQEIVDGYAQREAQCDEAIAIVNKA